MDDFRKYQPMRDQGINAEEIYLAGKGDGLDSIALVRLLRTVFNLSLNEGKEVLVKAENLGTSLDQFQEQLVPSIQELLEVQTEGENSKNGSQKDKSARLIIE